MLYASSALDIRAAATGTLKVDFVNPYGDSDPISPTDVGDIEIPERLGLVLTIDPFEGMGGSMTPDFNKVGNFLVTGFRYEQLDANSLQYYLVDNLRTSVFPNNSLESLTDDEVFKLFVMGYLSVKVTVGDVIASAGEYDSYYYVDFSVHTDQGPIHPSYLYDEVRSNVIDGTSAVDDLLSTAENTWPLTDPSATVGDILLATASDIYPWSALEQAKSDIGIDHADWMSVKDNQKQLFEAQLKERTGHGSGGSEYFHYDDNDRKNLFLLEAVTEYFLNFDEPWDAALSPSPVPWGQSPQSGSGATLSGATLTFASAISVSYLREMHHWIYIAADETRPGKMYRIMSVDPSGASVTLDSEPSLAGGGSTTDWHIDVRIKVNFFDPEGSSASVVSASGTLSYESVVQLDPGTDFSEVKAGFSTIYLEDADLSYHKTKTFLISDFDPELEQVTVEVYLSFSGSSDWRITNPPKLVIIDPLGPRVSGSGATLTSAPDVDLPDNPPFDMATVNTEFDHIYLEEDGSNRKTFRIKTKTDPTNVMAVDGTPAFASSPSNWSIPAGIGGSQNNVKSILTPSGAYDNYDGMLFLVHDNAVQATFPWSSYSSRKYIGQDIETSVKGNRRYDLISFTSSNEKLHYCFKVEDPFSGYDGVLEALKYYDTPPVPWDTTGGPTNGNGKTQIRIHWGYSTNKNQNNGSAGCLVSYGFLQLRNMMVDIHNASYQARDTGGATTDPDLTRLTGVTQAQNDDAHRDYRNWNGWDKITWQDKLQSRLYLIRPDELPHTP